MSKAANAYLATQVTTTSQGQLLLMLYEAAIKFIKQAKVKIKEKDYAAKGILISRAMDILSELNQSLNKERGGQIAQNLNSIYLFCNMQLAQANMRMTVKPLDEVITLLDSLRQAYAQIVPSQEGQLPTKQAAKPAQPSAQPEGQSEGQAAQTEEEAKPASNYPRPQVLQAVQPQNESENRPQTAQSRAANAYANSL